MVIVAVVEFCKISIYCIVCNRSINYKGFGSCVFCSTVCFGPADPSLTCRDVCGLVCAKVKCVAFEDCSYFSYVLTVIILAVECDVVSSRAFENACCRECILDCEFACFSVIGEVLGFLAVNSCLCRSVGYEVTDCALNGYTCCVYCFAVKVVIVEETAFP